MSTNSQTPVTNSQASTGDEGMLSRFRRTASTFKDQGLNYFTAQSQNETNQPVISDPSGTTEPNGPGPKGPVNEKEAPTAFERFVNLGKAKKASPVTFPPPHWQSGDETEMTDAIEPGQGGGIASEPHGNVEAVRNPKNASEPPDPDALAHRIQALLSSSPAASFSSPSPESEYPLEEMYADPEPRTDRSSTVANDEAVQGPPAAMTSDPKLISLLSSPIVMNGMFSHGEKGKGQTVWDALGRLKASVPSMNSDQSGDGQSNKGKAPSDGAVKEGDKHEEEVLEDDESGFMVYGPLFPSSDPAAASEVELAKSEIVTVSPEQKHADHSESHTQVDSETSKPLAPQPDKLDILKTKLEGIWPFAKGDAEKDQETKLLTSRVHFQPVKSDLRKRRVWVPSRDKISVQVMWWGYRIYLPPPVLDALDNSQLETAKRAALLTTALKYALDRIPLAVIPLQARPVLGVLKAFTPYLGYVGSFVAWSWAAVKGFDKGHGVTLSATWLLSVAVIPSTWDQDDFPASEVGGAQENAKGKERGTDLDGPGPPPLPPRRGDKKEEVVSEKK